MQSLLSKYKLFVFDWDNTLVSTNFLIKVSHLFKPRYIKYSKMPSYQAGIQAKPVKIDEKALEVESKVYSKLFDIYLMFFKPKPKPYAKDVLRLLKSAGKKLAVFSDGKGYRVINEARLQGLLNYFDIILSADMVNAYKPNPAPILALAERFHVSRKELLYVGDMVMDIATARSAGVDVCAIADGLSPYTALKQARPTYLIGSLESLFRLLEKQKD
ncbi:MAG: HAD family hydrolase [Candidatus Micrarchaeia archaeon]